LIPYLDILAESDDVWLKNREAFQLLEMENQNLEELDPDYGDIGSDYPQNYEMDVVPEDVEEESRGTI